MKRIFVICLSTMSAVIMTGCSSSGGINAMNHYVEGKVASSMMSTGACMAAPFAMQGCAKLTPVVINKCSKLTPKQKKEFTNEIKTTKNLDRAIIVYKTVPCGNPLEQTAKTRIIYILRDYELPKARTAKDFLNLCNRMPWTLCDVKKGILKTAIKNLENKYEIQKIIDVIYPKSDEIVVAGKKKIKEIEKRIKNKKGK